MAPADRACARPAPSHTTNTSVLSLLPHGIRVFSMARAAVAVLTHHALDPVRRAPTAATLPTDSATFGAVIIGTALLVGALTFLPALALGPIVEQLSMNCR
jgi:K+-transporting ATPase A subunit